MPKALHTPLKPGRNGTKSINKQIADLKAELARLEALIPTTATTAKAGTVKTGAAVVDCTSAPTVITQLNALLAQLRLTGVITP